MPMQELTTEYCWGAVWGREGLPHKTRSMLNLAMISVLNRPHELKMHIKGALKNGVTKAEIREVFLQVAIYAGIPAGVDSFRIAREAFAEVEKSRLTQQVRRGDGLMKRYQMLIGGEWVDAEARETFETENPYLGAAWAFVPRAKSADVDRAVEAARKAFRAPSWAKISATARGALLRKLADLIAAEADRLAEIETRDNGKLITEMRTQLRYIPQWFNYFGGLADKIEGRVIPIDKPGMINFTREEPLGVVAAITPWNSPLMLAAWKLAPALAAGNTVVWKPSEFSSVSALEFGRLFEKAGFPPGVVNILTGFGSEIGERLVTHPHVAKIAFTGGDRTGQGVYELAARSIKPVTLELGGKSANIVFKDAVIDNAVKGVVSGIFAATGQTCIAGSRALIHRSIHNEFVDKLVALGETARMGDPLLDTT